MLAESINRILEHIQNERHYKENKKEVAINAIYTALLETQLYFEARAKSGRNRDREEKISHLWAQAALAVRHMDKIFSDTLFVKSMYWVVPEKWSRKYILENRIALRQVTEKFKELISN